MSAPMEGSMLSLFDARSGGPIRTCKTTPFVIARCERPVVGRSSWCARGLEHDPKSCRLFG